MAKGGNAAGVNIASMTGFARTECGELGISWVWEIKSVNGKSLDLRLRLVPGFDGLEPQLRRRPCCHPDRAGGGASQPRRLGRARLADERTSQRNRRRSTAA